MLCICGMWRGIYLDVDTAVDGLSSECGIDGATTRAGNEVTMGGLSEKGSR